MTSAATLVQVPCTAHDITGQGVKGPDVLCAREAVARVTIDGLAGYADRPLCEKHLERTRRMHRRHYPTLVLTVESIADSASRPGDFPGTTLDQA